ncbi:histidine triad (HIT) family protein [Sphingobacterium allocomposti]|jgi:histidine triad (HIT) family protein|uniref:Histidine triad (HIT) family protein n=1 Tax=Sphingobacterium allocomposti TaxID=415956 RepID=A0A5S5DM38_9SPHI|nr:HIT family protein [Sphingobacterium composti Yoo et al. 2007 non Ten et al. 2007]TYP96106.1 histidine triad (HIT) family protein [Sphingobacterium composti Yoo et al. 2007 non Ten et al. 2007]HLS96203.1 HIT family protein [Sphingobacterium sp.]
MSTIFSKIVSGEIAAYKVAESNDYLAFLDVHPLTKGHVLVIPKKETDYIFDINDDEYMGMWVFAKIVAQGIRKVFPCRKVGVAVVGLEVAHAHIHLIPLNNVDDMNFARPKLTLADDEMVGISEAIREAISEVTNSSK